MNQPIKREMSGRIVVINIDGCISDDRWRRARVPEGASKPEHFAHYHAGASDDPPLNFGSAILMNHIANGDFIVFATGRYAKEAEATAVWIRRNFRIEPVTDFSILMRADDDQRPVVEVKREFAAYLNNSFCQQKGMKVVAAYDNRRDVVEVYREAGFESTILNENGEFVPYEGDDQEVDQKASSDQPPVPTGLHVPSRTESKTIRIDDLVNVSTMNTNGAANSVAREGFEKNIAELAASINSIGSLGAGLDAGVMKDVGIPSVLPLAEKVDYSNRKHSHYFKDVRHLDYVDVYRVLQLFNVTDNAIGHAIKKLLVAGCRGSKPKNRDISESIDSLQRWLELNAEDFFNQNAT